MALVYDNLAIFAYEFFDFTIAGNSPIELTSLSYQRHYGFFKRRS